MRFSVQLTILAVGVGLAAARARGDDASKALANLQGNWALASIEFRGKPVREIDEIKDQFVIKGNQMTLGDDQAKFKIVMKAFPDTDPMAVDFEVHEGDRKVLLEGICKVEGGTLKICLCNVPDLKLRPTEFVTKEDTDNLLLILKRSQP